MILAKRPRSDAEHGRAGSHKESKITSDFATSYCYHCPGHMDVFYQLPDWDLFQKVLCSIFRDPQIHNLAITTCPLVSVCRVDDLAGENIPPSGRPPQSPRITEEPPQRALISSTVDDDFLTKILYSTAHIDHFLIPYPFCAKKTFCLVETMITNVF